MKLIHVFLTVLLVVVPLYGEQTVVAGKHKVELIGPVTAKQVASFTSTFTGLLREDVVTIDVLINSPGGSVYDGTTVVDLLTMAKARGITVRCYVGGMAASMAFIILANCNERYVLPHSKLLFHPIAMFMMGIYELYSLEDYIEQTLIYERDVKRFLQKEMRIDRGLFEKNYKLGTLWHGRELAEVTRGFLTIVQDIQGFDNLFKEPKEQGDEIYRGMIIH